MPDANNQKVVLRTQRVTQNSQEFLIGVFTISEILKFTRYTEYTILGFDEENDNRPETNTEVQRKLSTAKVNQIVNFLLHDPMAIFPTNLVISIPNHVIQEQVETEGESNRVDIHLDDKVFAEIRKIESNQSGDIYLSIIDGQHRVRGIEKTIEYLCNEIELNERMVRTVDDPSQYERRLKEFKNKLASLREIELPVTFFIDPVLEYQAMIFSTINRTQTKVPPDLVYSLFGLTKKDSPQKSILNIVNALNGQKLSPFYKRIRLAGSGTKEARAFYKTGNPVLSQATVVKAILSFICENKQEEENARHFKRNYFTKNPRKGLPFRKYYGEDNDVRILEILDAYFTAVKKAFKDDSGNSLWRFEQQNTRKPKNILQTTIGFQALMELLRVMIGKIPEANRGEIEGYHALLVKAKDLDIKDDNDPRKYPFANRTKNIFYNDLGEKIWGASFEKKPVAD